VAPGLDIGLPMQLARAATWAIMLVVVLHIAEAGIATLAGHGIAMIYVELTGRSPVGTRARARS
jgi:Na+-driven multidrug efflux pump